MDLEKFLPSSSLTTYKMLVYEVKNVIIDELRETFSLIEDYKFVPNASGGPDFSKTKIVITDTYSYDIKFLPAVLVSLSGGSAKPISFNQDYRVVRAVNDNGNEYDVYQFAGAWDTNGTVTIATEDTISREELTGLISLIFEHWKRYVFIGKGIYVHSVSWSGETEEAYANDYVYMLNLSLGIYSEWHNSIVVGDKVEKIEVSLGYLSGILPDSLRPIKLVGGSYRYGTKDC